MQLDGRMGITEPSLATRERLLAARRAVARVLGLQELEANTWVQQARLARAEGRIETARVALLQARSLGASSGVLEAAQLLHSQGRVREALREIEPVAANAQALDHRASTMNAEEAKHEARRLLLATNWQLEAQCADRTVAARYRIAIKLGREWEAGYYHLGKYFDSVLKNLLDAVEAGDTQPELLQSRDKHTVLVVQHFSRALKTIKGPANHVYEMLPRVLTLFFDYGAAVERAATDDASPPHSSRSSGRAAAGGPAGVGRAIGAGSGSAKGSAGLHAQFARPADDCLVNLADKMESMLETMSPSRWMTVLPQLVSRICHRHHRVAGYISRALQLVLRVFPRQSQWTLVSLGRSSIKLRRERAQIVLSHVRSNPALRPQHDQLQLTDTLIQSLIQCARAAPRSDNAKEMTVAWDVSRRAFDAAGAYGVLVPTLKQLTVTIPEAPDALEAPLGNDDQAAGIWTPDRVAGSASGFDPTGSGDGGGGGGTAAGLDAEGGAGRLRIAMDGFAPASEQVLIAQLESKVAVMSSKEKPKRVSVRASDGRLYPFLCKMERRGDLRKDARVMDVATTVNRLLRRSTEGRRRDLRLRTYGVVVLNEDTGLAEWVTNTSTFRAEITKVYQANRLRDPMVVVTETYHSYQKEQEAYSHDRKLMATRFRFRWMTMFPAMFHQWFQMSFQSPAHWLAARTAFARSSAAWSMVGHLIGLGDRHGENILLDRATGECVHVDFDCIFDKGLRLRQPEVVPFRLTANMLDGMGLCGYEGVFRRSSEVCLSVLRAERDTMLSVLEPFVHDPLVEWDRKGRRDRERRARGLSTAETTGADGRMLPLTGVGGETVQEEGLEVMRRTGERLNGFYNYGHSVGQVALIAGRAAGNPGAGGTPLSVEGQVHRLIAEATSHENLCRLYVGWLPWL
jgi:serine/threonine-protein kinase ATR